MICTRPFRLTVFSWGIAIQCRRGISSVISCISSAEMRHTTPLGTDLHSLYKIFPLEYLWWIVVSHSLINTPMKASDFADFYIVIDERRLNTAFLGLLGCEIAFLQQPPKIDKFFCFFHNSPLYDFNITTHNIQLGNLVKFVIHLKRPSEPHHPWQKLASAFLNKATHLVTLGSLVKFAIHLIRPSESHHPWQKLASAFLNKATHLVTLGSLVKFAIHLVRPSESHHPWQKLASGFLNKATHQVTLGSSVKPLIRAGSSKSRPDQ